jgi:hypothetical protein
MAASCETAEAALDRLWIRGDLDRAGRAMDQLVRQGEPSTAVIDPSIDIFGPCQARGREHAANYNTVTRELRL